MFSLSFLNLNSFEKRRLEKRQLNQQWKSSLVGMTRRDEAVQNVQKAIDGQDQHESAVLVMLVMKCFVAI